MHVRIALFTLLLPLLLGSFPIYAQDLYSASLLPRELRPADINNTGQVTGSVTLDDGTSHAALWEGGGVIDLGIFGTGFSAATAINDAGVITGTTNVGTVAHAFVYDHGSVTDIGAGTYGLGINASGAVVGQLYKGDGYYTGFLYSGGMLTELGNLGTGAIGLANDINDAGKIVGESTISPDFHAPFHPVVYKPGGPRDLGTLGNFEVNSAQAINNAGLIAGYSETATGLHAFVYQHGVMTDVGGFGGLTLDIGDINEAGVFVGSASTDTGTDTGTTGFVWRNGLLIDLNDVISHQGGLFIDGAYGINDAGQIIAHGCGDAGCSAVLLRPLAAIPEPGSALLLAPGELLLIGARRRRHATTPFHWSRSLSC